MVFHYLFFVFFIAFVSIERIHKTFFSSSYKKRKKGKIIAKWAIILLSFFHIIVVLGTVIEYFIIKEGKVNYLISSIGVFMYFTALIVRRIAIKNLGAYYSIDVEIRHNHPLIKKGLYKYMRHPIYASTIIELLGIPLAGNAYFSFLIALICYMPILMIRTYIEEKVLIKHFGEEYLRYKKEVMAFLPFKRVR